FAGLQEIFLANSLSKLLSAVTASLARASTAALSPDEPPGSGRSEGTCPGSSGLGVPGFGGSSFGDWGALWVVGGAATGPEASSSPVRSRMRVTAPPMTTAAAMQMPTMRPVFFLGGGASGPPKPGCPYCGPPG